MLQPNGTQCASVVVRSVQANAAASYSQLPQGKFTRNQLLQLGTAPTALSFITGDPLYDLSFFNDTDTGSVCAQRADGSVAGCILQSFDACDGILHLTDNCFLPSTNVTALPSVWRTMYDLTALDLEGDDGSGPQRGLSTGALAGLAVGCTLAALALVACCWLFWRRLRRLRRAVHENDKSDALDQSSSSELDDALAGIETGLSNSDGHMSSHNTASTIGSGASTDSWDIRAEAVDLCLDNTGERVVLGRGGFGTVYRGVLNAVQHVAIKVLQDPGVDCLAAMHREVAMLRYVTRCREVVQFYGTCTEGDTMMIVSEVLEGGDLRAALSGPHQDELAWDRQGRTLALDIARGLCFLHANNVIHRDLKSKNVLLTADWGAAKIADVGLAAVHNEGYLSANGPVGTLAWAAPELLMGQRQVRLVTTAPVRPLASGSVGFMWQTP